MGAAIFFGTQLGSAAIKRKALSTRTRFEIFKRDQFTCSYCGRKPPEAILNVDHIIAVSKGGSNDSENLTTSCFDCNSGKSDVPLNQLPTPVNDARAMMVEREAQERAYINFIRARRRRQDKLIDEIGNALFGKGWTFKPDGRNSCRRFLEKLPFDVVYEMAERAAAVAHSPLRYFCACCWQKIREAEDAYGQNPHN